MRGYSRFSPLLPLEFIYAKLRNFILSKRGVAVKFAFLRWTCITTIRRMNANCTFCNITKKYIFCTSGLVKKKCWILIAIMSTQITFVLHFMNKHECGTQSAWMRLWLLRSHGTERIFDRLQNLSGHFVHSGSFNIFALFTLYFERLVRLKFCTIEVIPCKRKSLHTRIFIFLQLGEWFWPNFQTNRRYERKDI